MIRIFFDSGDPKDQKTKEGFQIKDLTRSEAALCIQWLETTKLDLVDREFELGENGFEILEEDEG